MTRHWLAVVVPLLWSLEVRAVYHELSMTSFRPPTDDVKSDSLFGYSLAYQPQSRKLITSAPRFGTGIIYECSIDTQKCNKIEVNGTEGYKYGDMWLGATVATGHNFTLACAPRYTTSVVHKTYKVGTYGRCFAQTSEPVMTEMPAVILSEIFEVFEKNMFSFGWSIDVDKFDMITIGGPAVLTGRVVSYNDSDATPTLLTAPKGAEPLFNFGYAVTSGNFLTGNENDIVHAISSPYGQIGYGMVMLSNVSNSWHLPPPSRYPPGVGSLFGGALAAASLRGPGQRQALLIGAPTYAEKGRVDVGAVYIYQFDLEAANVGVGMVHHKTILGKKDNAQFGSAIIRLGDLNGDQRDEIAVAAPYEDSGKGAVYIYSGGHLLSDVADRMLQSLQRIQPEGFRAFGLSLAALQDYDGNGCNELAIGSPDSKKIVLLRCMASIKVDVRRLQEQKRQNDTYYTFKSCMDIVYPEKPNILQADIQFRISISHKDAKLVNSTKDNKVVEQKIFVQNEVSPMCMDVGIIIPKVVGYEPSIQYQITATQLNSPVTEKKFDSSHVLLSDLSVLNVSDTVWVADCAGKNECKPKFNLSIQATIKDGYTIGSSDTESVSFSAWNSGDVAYKPRAQVVLNGVRVVRLPSTCSLRDDELDCFPKQPVEKNTLWQSEQIELDMKSLRSNVKTIKVSVFIYGNDQPKEEPIKSEQTFNLQSDHKRIMLKGSTHNTIHMTKEELMESGKDTLHVYTVYNNGMTSWVNLNWILLIDLKPHYKDFTLKVESQALSQCQDPVTRDNLKGTFCTITELRKYQKFEIIIPIYVQPGKIDIDDLADDKKNKVIVKSYLKLMYGDKHQNASIESTVRLKEAVVPIWIVIIAALVGLIIIIIIAFALYECGFLRRKNKDKLKRLRRSVHRQSVHRSMRISNRVSIVPERRSGDREKLLAQNDKSVSEKKEGNTNTGMEKIDTETPKNTTEMTKSDTNMLEENTELPIKAKEMPKNDKILKTGIPETGADLIKNTMSSDTDAKILQDQKDTVKDKDKIQTNAEIHQSDTDVDNEIPKKVAAKSKIINNDHIIRGLQKMVQNRSMTSLPVTAKEAKEASSENVEKN